MSVIAVVGAQWGDEGKGKIVDMVAQQVDVVVRFSGGDNAGHTVVNDAGEFKLHLIPSGIFSPTAVCIIGNGVVLNPSVFLDEIDSLKKRQIDTSRLFISERAHLIMPYHPMFDGLEESWRGGKAIGTTLKGIGPAFADKVGRVGIKVGDLLDKDIFWQRLNEVLGYKNAILKNVHGVEPLSAEAIFEEYLAYGQKLAPYICETNSLLHDLMRQGKRIMLEGAQGALLDPDFGTYPYTTSSSPLAASGCLGAGLGPVHINRVLGVFKAYCTRVGGGAFPTEIEGEIADRIRDTANEYGTTTGRPRRCGWFDAVASRFSHRINGYTGMAITRLDVLDILPSLKICTSYEFDGKQIDYLPSSISELARCRPVYEEMPGWQTPITGTRNFEDLPVEAKQYVRRLEELTGCQADIISIGKEREETIQCRSLV